MIFCSLQSNNSFGNTVCIAWGTSYKSLLLCRRSVLPVLLSHKNFINDFTVGNNSSFCVTVELHVVVTEVLSFVKTFITGENVEEGLAYMLKN